ncbi:hypothetical protein ACFSQ7_18675 [Paenibacillus rhizoplanae]
MLRPAKSGDYRELVSRLKNSGWLFSGASQQSRYQFQVPLDLKKRFREQMAQHLQERIVPNPEPSVYRGRGICWPETCCCSCGM